jgi:GDPmannose 4,6-dehydratase
VQETPQRETTPFYPRSPYGAAKLYAYWITVNYREAYGLYACNGILFNHESPIRGETFVTRKITRALARIRVGLQDCLYLGNLDARRDWGHARDYVRAQWLMLQQPRTRGLRHRHRRSSTRCASSSSAPPPSSASRSTGAARDVEEVGVDRTTGRTLVRIDPRYFRPAEVDSLLGDASKARAKLGWRPEVSFEDLVKEMVATDLDQAKRHQLVASQGFRTFRRHE